MRVQQEPLPLPETISQPARTRRGNAAAWPVFVFGLCLFLAGIHGVSLFVARGDTPAGNVWAEAIKHYWAFLFVVGMAILQRVWRAGQRRDG